MKLSCSTCGKENPKRCGQQECPFFISRPRVFKQEFFGSTPNIFVGNYGYPNVRVGMLATEQYDMHDDPKLWSQANTPIPDIVERRGSLVNSQFLANIRSHQDSFLQQAQLVAQGKMPADIEVKLDKAPSFSLAYPKGTIPHGSTVKLVDSRLTENVKISKAVDKAVSDTDLKAAQAITQLYGRIDEYALQKLLTGGLLGQGSSRKLVPTRWAITATDDTIGKEKLEKLRTLPVLGEPMAFFGGHYGNHYAVLLFPRKWSYELFEFMQGGGKNWTDYEDYYGRKNYAEDTAGGYYAARLPIIEKLLQMKRQASVLCLRFVTDEYTNPLGVWVVREAVRKALEQKPLSFADEDLLLKYGRARSWQFKVNYETEVKARSKLIESFKQKSVFDY